MGVPEKNIFVIGRFRYIPSLYLDKVLPFWGVFAGTPQNFSLCLAILNIRLTNLGMGSTVFTGVAGKNFSLKW